VVALEVDDATAFSTPLLHQFRQPPGELDVAGADEAAAVVDDVAVEDDRLGVVDRLGQPARLRGAPSALPFR